jgi:protein SCO1/2
MARRFTIQIKSLLLVGALTLVGALSAAAQTPPAGQPNINTNANIGIDQKLDAQIPLDLTFTDQTGKKVKLGDYFGHKPVVLALPFYRCAGMCTLEMDGMAKAFNAISFTAGKEFNAVTVSIDPKETWTLASAKQKDYLDLYKRPEAEKGWSFLTGEDANIHKLADAVGFRYVIDPKTQQPIHSVGIVVITPEGHVSRYLLGVDYSPKDLKLCLVDASHNKIGSLVDKFTLLCSHYDPTTSRYGVAIDRIIKFTCTLTVLILASAIFMLFRFEKQRQSELIAKGLMQAPLPKAKKGARGSV